MKKSLTFAILAAVAAPAVSHADKTLLGAQLQFIPSGEVDVDAEGDFGPIGGGLPSEDFDLESAFGIALAADYIVHPNITVGFAPRVVFGLKGEDADDSTTELDLPIRGTGRYLVGNKVALFGYLQVGYSLLFPEDWNEDVAKPKGFLWGAGAGAAYAISSNLAIVGELGYTNGSQKSHEEGEVLGVPYEVDVTVAPSFLHIGVGVQTAL